jgi:hypothetical protein
MAEPSQDPGFGVASETRSADFRPPVLEALELGLELAASGRLLAGSLRRLPVRGGARLAAGTLRAAGRGAAAAALLEAPVALIEETLAVRSGRKTPEQAALAAGGKVGVAALGGGLGAGLAWGLGAMGVGAALAPVAPALLLAGGATVVISTGMRLREAFAAAAPPALAPEPPPDFIEMRRGEVLQGTEIWYVSPTDAPASPGDRGTGGDTGSPGDRGSPGDKDFLGDR